MDVKLLLHVFSKQTIIVDPAILPVEPRIPGNVRVICAHCDGMFQVRHFPFSSEFFVSLIFSLLGMYLLEVVVVTEALQEHLRGLRGDTGNG